MSDESDLYSALSGHGGLSALVSTRIYPLILPAGQDTMPAVIYQAISITRLSQLGSNSTDGKHNIRFQIASWGDTYASAKAVAEQVRQAMETASAFTAIHVAENDIYDDDQDRFGVAQDFSMWHA